MEQNQNPQPPVFNQQQGPQPAQQYQPRVMARPMMEPVEAVMTCLQKFFDFRGRARRSEYWWFFLFTFIVSWVFSFLGNMMTPVFTYIGLFVGLLLWIPQFAVLTRRLHDRNHSGWWVFAMFVCTLVAYGSFAVMLAPHMSALMGEGDNMAMMLIIADAVQEMPQAMAVAAVAGVCYFILFVITLVFAVQDSHWNENKYGTSPKYQ